MRGLLSGLVAVGTNPPTRLPGAPVRASWIYTNSGHSVQVLSNEYGTDGNSITLTFANATADNPAGTFYVRRNIDKSIDILVYRTIGVGYTVNSFISQINADAEASKYVKAFLMAGAGTNQMSQSNATVSLSGGAAASGHFVNNEVAYARIRAEGGPIRYRIDGAYPTELGTILRDYDTLELLAPEHHWLEVLKAISFSTAGSPTADGGTIKLSYELYGR